MPDKMNDVAVDAELRGYTNEQASEAEQRAIEFLTKAVRIPGVRVDRDRYLREALERQQLLGAMDESDVRSLLTRRIKGARSRLALGAAAVSASISSALAASLAQYDAEHGHAYADRQKPSEKWDAPILLPEPERPTWVPVTVPTDI